MLSRVDALRVSPYAQQRYSQRDDLQFFISVTEDLYRTATEHELITAEMRHRSSAQGDSASGSTQLAKKHDQRGWHGLETDAEKVAAALNQVYTVRHTARRRGDVAMESFLGTLIHVRYDYAIDCPVAPGQRIGVDRETIDVTSLSSDGDGRGRPVALGDLIARGCTLKRPRCVTVVLAGSWT